MQATDTQATGLAGKTALVTGATSGIGLAAARALSTQGVTLTLLCRSTTRAEAVADELQAASGRRPALLLADMADLSQVRHAAQSYLDRAEDLDILLNNAGVINTSRRETVDGFEETFAVNHLAPFLLTGMLLPRLQARQGSRIVNVASNAHHFCRGMEFDDLQSQAAYKTFNVYGRSKLANILFTRELASRLPGGQPTVNSLHPGAVASGMGTNNGGMLGSILPLLLKPFFRSPEKGAETALYLCSDPRAADISGKYFIDKREVTAKAWARDADAAQKLWLVSEELTGFSYQF